MSNIKLESVITCPYCGAKTDETMPIDYCQVRYLCPHCQNVLRPQQGHCCVYCSYGSAKCPSMQCNEDPS